METEVQRRLQDLRSICRNKSIITVSGFLSPAEQKEAESMLPEPGTELCLFGGDEFCERKAAFFYPDYFSADDIVKEEYIWAVKLKVYRETLSHRDILGSVIGSGLKREVIGDIRVFDDTAYLFARESAAKALDWSLERIGRNSCKTEIVGLMEVPKPEILKKEIVFTVQSIRLDAVLAGIFHISRSDAVTLIQSGNVSLNYVPCLKPDTRINEGDILSARGCGKGELTEIRGESRKGRTFISAVRYL